MRKHTKLAQKDCLDIGGGDNPQRGFLVMDKRKTSKVDIVHDAEKFPYPFSKNTFKVVVMSHLIEHIKPWFSIEVMNECWRIIKPSGILVIITPYATSFGYSMDPTHCNPWNEATPEYFSPNTPFLYEIYKPKPWKIEKKVWDQKVNMEVVFRKISSPNGGKKKENT